MGIEWMTIATGSTGNCYLLSNGKSKLLLEAGIRFRHIREKTGFALSDIDGCLVTHSHGDHAKGIKELVRAGVNVYSAQETFDAMGATGHRCVPIEARKQVMVGAWTVMPFETVHDTPGSLGFIIASGRYKLLFITDTAYIKPTVPGLTHMVVEANFSEKIIRRRMADGELHPARVDRLRKTHMSIERLLELLAANDLSRVVWIRLVHLSNENSDEAMFRDMVQRATGKPVYIEG
ncbi:MAG: MBL fold metallo-hydrolase [Desulfofustis sp.]|nr:MBL fold metallo-hydrolase [Desulfofustis sp.]